ncbi:cytochrome c3 family protein [Desulfurivibrio alkaliphilus]|uniref:Cytochrome C family protein n=1 Tax=Desulfurivibrio alkaliphilus (strain DSM 19089 / UNIQEM U267 / AHT2) TaxID=589865 RepID=D6YZU1_DESAT|nr:cytochrome c3 family protein [Desulfurivibrio alkaliphilus]ADH85098.1 cytochrome C family protein [Desulfurivibrio alkaliphilus AHT 2]
MKTFAIFNMQPLRTWPRSAGLRSLEGLAVILLALGLSFTMVGQAAGSQAENCLSCHHSKKEWQNRPHIHPPMNEGCGSCHGEPHSDEHRRQLRGEGARQLCIDCHPEMAASDPDRHDSVRFVHGIIGGAGCTGCHDPHTSDHPFLLVQPINRLCLSCHPRLRGVSRGHPISGHPVAGHEEGRRPGRQLSCSSCHDPHGSPFRHLLFETPLGGYFCHECHDGLAPKQQTSAR